MVATSLYKCVFHPSTLLMTGKTIAFSIAFFVGRGH